MCSAGTRHAAVADAGAEDEEIKAVTRTVTKKGGFRAAAAELHNAAVE